MSHRTCLSTCLSTCLKAALTAAVPALLATAAAQTAPGAHQGDGHGADMRLSVPADIAWKDGPGSLPKGARFAVLEGDPSKEGFFVMRLWMPDGYRIQPHSHPKTERITVISGTFQLGMGDKFDAAATTAMPAGTFGYWGAGMKHFAWSKGDTVLQLHGVGPWTITYVNPADDPRTPKQ